MQRVALQCLSLLAVRTRCVALQLQAMLASEQWQVARRRAELWLQVSDAGCGFAEAGAAASCRWFYGKWRSSEWY